MSIKDLDKSEIDSIMNAISSVFKAVIDVAVCYSNLTKSKKTVDENKVLEYNGTTS